MKTDFQQNIAIGNWQEARMQVANAQRKVTAANKALGKAEQELHEARLAVDEAQRKMHAALDPL